MADPDGRLLDEQAGGMPDGGPGPDGEETPAGRGSRWSFSGWYAAGVGVQLLLWLFVFLGLALAVLGDNVLTEFRYVGF